MYAEKLFCLHQGSGSNRLSDELMFITSYVWAACIALVKLAEHYPNQLACNVLFPIVDLGATDSTSTVDSSGLPPNENDDTSETSSEFQLQ